MTFYEASVRARALLIDAVLLPHTATLDADLLARHALQWDLATWLARRGDIVDADFQHKYEALIKRRLTREPVAYIRGVQEFWGREFLVSSAVLIPRPETELLVEHASGYLRDNPTAVVADVGTGSGCIAITLSLEHPDATVYAVDIAADALQVAQQNAARLGANRVHFVLGSHLDGVPRPGDLIASNPPYVAERDRIGLSPEVRDHEPSLALFGGSDGWTQIRALLRASAEALSAQGLLLMELGFGQSEQLAPEMASVPSLRLENIAQDLQGIPRLAQIRRS